MNELVLDHSFASHASDMHPKFSFVLRPSSFGVLEFSPNRKFSDKYGGKWSVLWSQWSHICLLAPRLLISTILAKYLTFLELSFPIYKTVMLTGLTS